MRNDPGTSPFNNGTFVERTEPIPEHHPAARRQVARLAKRWADQNGGDPVEATRVVLAALGLDGGTA